MLQYLFLRYILQKRTKKKNMKTTVKISVIGLILFSAIFTGCKKEDETPAPTNNNNNTDTTHVPLQVFKCKIDGVSYEATYIVNEGNYASGAAYAKSLKTTNGTNAFDGTIRISLSFGTDNQGNLSTGAHEIITAMNTMTGFNNMGKATFKDLFINGSYGYVQDSTGTVSVINYYGDQSSGWLGARGTFNNITIYTFNTTTMEQDTLLLTDGEFDYKFTL